MAPLTRADLLGLEAYARERQAFRARVMAHKRNRRVALGPNATLCFEDALTMQYQVQEMLRAERIFEPAGIDEELATYNPLIPDGSNLKATFMLEYADVAQRRAALAALTGVEHGVWLAVADGPRVAAIANEDLERSTPEKTSAVHFLRFELTAAMVASLHAGATLACGIDHPALTVAVPVAAATRAALAADLTPPA